VIPFLTLGMASWLFVMENPIIPTMTAWSGFNPKDDPRAFLYDLSDVYDGDTNGEVTVETFLHDMQNYWEGLSVEGRATLARDYYEYAREKHKETRQEQDDAGDIMIACCEEELEKS